MQAVGGEKICCTQVNIPLLVLRFSDMLINISSLIPTYAKITFSVLYALDVYNAYSILNRSSR